MPSLEVRRLRAGLIMEEAVETVKALGFEVAMVYESFLFEESGEPDLVEIADGCADLRVVTTGTLSACGIDDKALQNEVDRNNLLKVGPGSRIREDGKVMKPLGHEPPDIRGILQQQRWDGKNS